MKSMLKDCSRWRLPSMRIPKRCFTCHAMHHTAPLSCSCLKTPQTTPSDLPFNHIVTMKEYSKKNANKSGKTRLTYCIQAVSFKQKKMIRSYNRCDLNEHVYICIQISIHSIFYTIYIYTYIYITVCVYLLIYMCVHTYAYYPYLVLYQHRLSSPDMLLVIQKDSLGCRAAWLPLLSLMGVRMVKISELSLQQFLVWSGRDGYVHFTRLKCSI